MTKVQISLPDAYMEKLSRLREQTDEICGKMLEAGAEVVEEKVRAKLQSVVGSGTKTPSRSTGELLRSLGSSKVRQGADGTLNVKVGFAEPRSDGESNAKIASIIEYGKHGQPPKPFLKPAKAAARADCIEAMQRVLEEEAGKL